MGCTFVCKWKDISNLVQRQNYSHILDALKEAFVCPCVRTISFRIWGLLEIWTLIQFRVSMQMCIAGKNLMIKNILPVLWKESLANILQK